MVGNTGGVQFQSSNRPGNGSDKSLGVVDGTSKGALSHSSDPTGIVNPSVAEVLIGSGANRRLIGELAKDSVRSTHDAAGPALGKSYNKPFVSVVTLSKSMQLRKIPTYRKQPKAPKGRTTPKSLSWYTIV